MQTVTGIRIQEIGIHRRMHLDEIVAIFILRLFGGEKYQDIAKAKVRIFAGNEDLQGKSADEWMQEEVLLVGFGGGMFDEHATRDQLAKEGECAATLVAKDLGVDHDESLRLILEAAFIFDSQNLEIEGEDELSPDNRKKLKAVREWSLPVLVKQLNGMFPEEPERVLDAILPFIEAKYAAQVEFIKAKTELKKKAFTRNVSVGGNTLVVLGIHSDNESVQKAARNRYGGSLAVLVQAGSRGHVQIFGNKKAIGSIHDVASAIRREVQKRTNSVAHLSSSSLEEWGQFWKEQSKKGQVEGADQLYYMPEGGFILNGSLSHPKTPAIPMTLVEVVDVVEAVLNDAIFPSGFESGCKAGRCTSSGDNRCPFFEWGLPRCQKIRGGISKK